MELGVEKSPSAVHASFFPHSSRISQDFDPIVAAVAVVDIATVVYNIIIIIITFVTVFVSSMDTVALQRWSKNKQWLQETISCSWKWIDQTVSTITVRDSLVPDTGLSRI